jgi:hypothetical protein
MPHPGRPMHMWLGTEVAARLRSIEGVGEVRWSRCQSFSLGPVVFLSVCTSLSLSLSLVHALLSPTHTPLFPRGFSIVK